MNKLKLKIILINIATTFSLAIFFITDRFLKNISLNLDPNINLVKDFFVFSFTKNYFISFSLPLSGPVLNIFIVLMTLLLLFYLIFLILKEKEKRVEIFLLLFIFFGALSNVIDRLSLGFVIDYLELRNFSAFNLADIMITIPSLILILKNLELIKRKTKET